jgi:hypothetical protein
VRTIALVAGIPALVAAIITLVAVLDAPTWVIWPLVAAAVAAAAAVLLYLRAKNWLMYAIVVAATGCLVRGGLGITFDVKGRLSDQSQDQSRDGFLSILFTTSSDTVSVTLIVAGILLFGLAVLVHLFTREPHESKPPPIDEKQRRVWEILNSQTGIRTVRALEKADGKTGTRIQYLRGTVDQLNVAGAQELASKLELVLGHSWPQGSQGSREAIANFLTAAKEFTQGGIPDR